MTTRKNIAIASEVVRAKTLLLRNIFLDIVHNSHCPASSTVNESQQQQLRVQDSKFCAAIKSLLDHGVDDTVLQNLLNDDPEATPATKHWYKNLVVIASAKLAMQVVGQRPDARPDAGPAADPRAKSSEESTPESIARVELFAETDKAIITATDFGLPVWNTLGNGGEEPNRRSHDFWWNNLKDSAKIDFYRGLNEDDFENKTWAQWLKSLPRYRSKVMRNFGDIQLRSQGNAMEMIAGISYTAFRNSKNLPKTQSLVFPNDKSKDAWCKVWERLEQLGAQVSDTARTTSAGQPSQPSQSWNADINAKKRGLVERLMDNKADVLPGPLPAYKPEVTVDEWVAELHKAVHVSKLCAWSKEQRGKDECIQAIGIATLNYGYKFKLRFKDPYHGNGDNPAELINEKGQLCFHGAAIGGVLPILRDGFKPSITKTGHDKLKAEFDCVPPLVWFSRTYATAAGYPQNWSNEDNVYLGEPIATDAPQPMRCVFHVRVDAPERLFEKKKKNGKNDQHAFSPESVLHIVGLDIIATSCSADNVAEMRLIKSATCDIRNYYDIAGLTDKLQAVLKDDFHTPEDTIKEYLLDPRGVQTKTCEEMIRLQRLVRSG